MCRRVACSVCGKPTFAGCGMHIEQVLGDVPAAQRCQGHAQESAQRPEDGAARSPGRSKWWPF